MWGRTVLDTEEADLVCEVNKAFSTKPCTRDLTSQTYPMYHKNSSNTCLLWSKEKYAGVNSLRPALCQECKNSISEIKAGESLDEKMEIDECLVEPKAETDSLSNDGHDGDCEDTVEGDFGYDQEPEKEDPNISTDTGSAKYICKICNKIYKGKMALFAHGGHIHKEKRCTECSEMFASFSLLEAHCTSLNHVLQFKCDYCHEVFNDKGNRWLHVQREHNVEDIKVDVINGKVEVNVKTGMRGSSNISESKNGRNKWIHKRRIQAVKSCSECGEKFATLELLKDHCNAHNHGFNYMCDFCQERFSDMYEKKVHVQKEHSKMDNYNGPRYQYKCPLCDESFIPDKYALWEHLRSFHKEESVDCEVESCYYTCVGPQLLLIHNLSKHKKQENGYQKSLSCDICSREIKLAHALAHYRKDHYLELDNGQRFPCQHCKEIFKSVRARTIHTNEAHLKISYDCDKCGKSFKRSINQLRQHIRKVHMKDSQKKQCHICQEWRISAEDLAAHIRRKHTGERPFNCVFCGQTFFSAQNVNQHKRYKHPDSFDADQKRKTWIHNNPTRNASEYSMKCHLCNEERTTINELRQHWEEIHPGLTDKPSFRHSKANIICEMCGTAKSTYKLLKIHTFEKHDTDNTNCPVCSEVFSDREGALKHVKINHKPNVKDYPSHARNGVCPHCGFIGALGNVRSHIAKVHDNSKPTSCMYCHKEFPHFHNMVKHRKIAHREQWNIDKARVMVEEGSYASYSDYLEKSDYKKKKWYKKATCTICGRTLCSRTQLHFHMKALHGIGLPDHVPRQKC